MMNKRGEQLAYEEIIFIVLNLTFFVIFLLFVTRVSSGDLAMEEFYAKEIALIIDSALPDHNVRVDISPMLKNINKNKLDSSQIVSFNNNQVNVRLSNSGGYSYSYFNDIQVKESYETSNNRLILNLNFQERENE